MNITFIIGIIGMSFILLAFILDEFVKKFNQDTIQYNLLNILGSSLLAYYAFVNEVWPFLILNLLWFLVAGYKLILLKFSSRNANNKRSKK
jgi:hypothetical protein